MRPKRRLSKKPDTLRYAWDVEDRLTSCTTPDGTLWTYRYDPLGRRTAKYRHATDGSVVEEIHFSWDGTRLAEQLTPGTGVALTWDHEGHRPLTQTERRLDLADQSEIDSRFFTLVTDLVGTPTEAWRFERDDVDVVVTFQGIDLFRAPARDVARRLAEAGYETDDSEEEVVICPNLALLLSRETSREVPLDPTDGLPLHFHYALAAPRGYFD